MLKFIKNLSGHSGCEISLWTRENGEYFVRKKSASITYNRRLKKQYIKQNKYNLCIAKTPQIYGCGIEDGLFFFDMEYVPCMTFCEYVNSVKITELVDFIKILFSNLPVEKSNKNPLVNKIFEKKIKSVYNIIDSKNPVLKRAFELLIFNDWGNVVQSPSHGDLTLENILISTNHKIYLIDFLDTFYSSWMVDLAKIFQDLEVKWSFRNMKPDTNRDLRLLIAKETLNEMILSLPNGKNILSQIYKILVLNLLRIIPYTTDEKTEKFLFKAIENTLNIIEKMEAKNENTYHSMCW